MTHIFHRNPALPLPVAVRGEGCYLIDTAGRRYFDGSGGAAVSCLGHAHPRVIAAMQQQMATLEYAHTSFFSSEPAEQLANLLADNSPSTLGNVYFLSGGSEAMETALKMARQYHVENGQAQRQHFVSRRQSYHGNTLGALSIGGNLPRRKLYEPLLMKSTQVSPCFAFRYQRNDESDADYVDRLGLELEQTFLVLGPQSVAAFVAETVVGATSGAVAPVPGYLERMRQICDRHGVLLILDEVMCGIGRTGTYHAFEQENVVPDLLVLAKGLGGGFQPIGAVMASDRVVHAISSGSGSFQHGHTYIGHPIACAAALAVQQEIIGQNLCAQVRSSGELLARLLDERFANHPHVADIRGRGLFWAIELVQDRDGNRPFAANLRVHSRIKTAAQARGLLCYPGGGTVDGLNGDHVLLAPPYISTPEQLAFAVDTLAVALDESLATCPSTRHKEA
ncbi:aminotransferase [Pseudomonas sp. Ost2]|uniref:aspartate aminotransferase family protein n=1 Tax=Pseudomonas TaxID=286 RepID=UPI0015A3217C|nr:MULTISPECIES: aspartate aminotransferase family protein [Pseudomonas]NVZ60500.1 aspartate aminotransferase family protein [Pseudomonas gingeri]NVZ78355.1 aspartate aminotransferase family protein [Pseudomonas gingeri]BBP77852.1 aminotransferase [Pseudomonas sp. Ost2]